MSDFPAALRWILQREGGYVNDPADPGGETNFGISKRAYPDVDIKNLTRDQAATLYQRDYWIPAGCDTLDQGPALAVFDTAVNLGVSRALALWQAAAGDVEELLWARLAYYSGLTHLARFMPGWLKRVLLLRRTIHGAPT
jgi:lysozyme family protein